jgi:UDP-N-acetylmuramoyl-tripeptide--D-alanyl-D-alanine ligase
VYNALVAIAVGELFKIPKNIIAEALLEVQAYDMRMQIIEENGITVISDCYNANPHSMKMSLQTLAGMPCNNRKIAILGDMKELGLHSKKYHREIGSVLPELSIDYLVAIGSDAMEYCNGAEKAGLKSSRIKYFKDKQSAIEALKLLIRKGDFVLVKASRSMKLEEVSASLLEQEIA